MRHKLGKAWEPVGSHGMNYRRQCQVCDRVFTVNSPTEEVNGECDLQAVRAKQFFGHPDAGGHIQ